MMRLQAIARGLPEFPFYFELAFRGTSSSNRHVKKIRHLDSK
jgi:hypothetical protein